MTNSQTAPILFQKKLQKPTHKYPTNFSTSNYSNHQFQVAVDAEFESKTGIVEEHSKKF